MASRRMFACAVIDTDRFAEMPLSTQALYFQLGMRGDDDGFVSNPNQIRRMIGASEDDLRLLIAKGYIIAFESGIVVITHWKRHNYIQKDRYKPTDYSAEKAQLIISGDAPYLLSTSNMDTVCVQSVSNMETDCIPRLGKDRLDKDSIGGTGGDGDALPKAKTRFTPPPCEQVQEYMTEYARDKGLRINAAQQASRFVDYYESNGWKVGRAAMKDWHAAARRWLGKGWNVEQTADQASVPPQGFTPVGDLYAN